MNKRVIAMNTVSNLHAVPGLLDEIRGGNAYKAARQLLLQKKMAQRQIKELDGWLDVLEDLARGAVTLAMRDIQNQDNT
jgi:hypothetical protein